MPMATERLSLKAEHDMSDIGADRNDCDNGLEHDAENEGDMERSRRKATPPRRRGNDLVPLGCSPAVT